MKSIYIILTSLFLTLAKFEAISQTTSAPAANNPALKEAALKANVKAIKERNAQMQASKSPTYVGQLDENDKYLGKEKEYLNMITLDALPSDFPLYQKGTTFVDYDFNVELYFRNHTSILKEIYKTKFQ